MTTPKPTTRPGDDDLPEVTCYRHHERRTFVSCGRCGKPLCPDCVHHGPTGVRCIECLRPSHGRVSATMHAPQHLPQAYGLVALLGIAWLVVLVAVNILPYFTVRIEANYLMQSPSLLFSGVAGATIGAALWRVMGRTWNNQAVGVCIAVSALVPLLAALSLHVILRNTMHMPDFLLLPSYLLWLRTLAACILSAFFAWLFVTYRNSQM